MRKWLKGSEMPTTKKCDRCKVANRVGKTKFCKECKKIVLTELRETGYLTTGGYGHGGMTRTADQKER